MTAPARTPAEAYPLAYYVAEEMEARGWNTDTLARRMGGQFGMNAVVLGFLLFVHEDGLLVDDETFGQLAHAFGVSEQLFRNLDAMWRAAPPDTRVKWEAPETLVGPAGVGTPPLVN